MSTPKKVRATLDHLTKPSIDHGIVDVDGVEFEIRPLSRKQQIEVQELREREGLAPADALLCHYGLIDPALTLGEVEAWHATEGQGQAASAVSQGIGTISGMFRDSGKAAYKSAG
jgi:hypothetical protein